MVLQLNLLVEPFVADITFEELEVRVGLAVLLQRPDGDGPVLQTLDALVEVAVLGVVEEEVEGELRPGRELLAAVQAPQAVSLVTVQVVVKGLFLLKKKLQ